MLQSKPKCYMRNIVLQMRKRMWKKSKRMQLSDWLCHQCALIRRAGPQLSADAVEEGTQKNVWNINTCHRASSCFPLPPVQKQHCKHRDLTHTRTNRTMQTSGKLILVFYQYIIITHFLKTMLEVSFPSYFHSFNNTTAKNH